MHANIFYILLIKYFVLYGSFLAIEFVRYISVVEWKIMIQSAKSLFSVNPFDGNSHVSLNKKIIM